MFFGRRDAIKLAFKKMNLAAVCGIRELWRREEREEISWGSESFPGPGQQLTVDYGTCPSPGDGLMWPCWKSWTLSGYGDLK